MSDDEKARAGLFREIFCRAAEGGSVRRAVLLGRVLKGRNLNSRGFVTSHGPTPPLDAALTVQAVDTFRRAGVLFAATPSGFLGEGTGWKAVSSTVGLPERGHLTKAVLA